MRTLLLIAGLILGASALGSAPPQGAEESPCLEIQKYPGNENSELIERCKNTKKQKPMAPKKVKMNKKKKVGRELK